MNEIFTVQSINVVGVELYYYDDEPPFRFAWWHCYVYLVEVL